MVLFQCMNPPRTVTLKLGRNGGPTIKFPDGEPIEVTNPTVITMLDRMRGFQRA